MELPASSSSCSLVWRGFDKVRAHFTLDHAVDLWLNSRCRRFQPHTPPFASSLRHVAGPNGKNGDLDLEAECGALAYDSPISAS